MDDSLSQPAADRSQTSAPVPTKRRILYADDVRELRELMMVALARDGYSVDCVTDGAQALEKLHAEPAPFDLLITDHHMPRMNGIELVKNLRREGYPGKILIFSSDLSQELNSAYRELRVEKFLFKPVFPSVLRQVLKDIFSTRPAEFRSDGWRRSD